MSQTIRDIIRKHSRPLQPRTTGHPTQLTRLSDIRAVLFDIYGTLFISGCGDVGTSRDIKGEDEGNDRVFYEALAAADIGHRKAAGVGGGLLIDTIQRVHTKMRQTGIEYPEVDIVEIWRTALQALQQSGVVDEASISEESLRNLTIEYEVRNNPVWPMPGALESLLALRGGGIVSGVVSNAQFFTPELFPALLNREMDELGFDARLRHYSYEHRRAKPGTLLYELAAQELRQRGISPSQTLFVGNDMLNDVAAAEAVGFRTALFAGDARSLRLREGDDRVGGVTPDIVVDDLRQLPQCVLGGER